MYSFLYVSHYGEIINLQQNVHIHDIALYSIIQVSYSFPLQVYTSHLCIVKMIQSTATHSLPCNILSIILLSLTWKLPEVNWAWRMYVWVPITLNVLSHKNPNSNPGSLHIFIGSILLQVWLVIPKTKYQHGQKPVQWTGQWTVHQSEQI